jgi:cell pole-organizing protein PopZ
LSSAPRPLIAPLAPQLQGSLRDLKISVQPAQTPGLAGTGRTEDLLALRSRIADLSATRERLARLSAGGPSSFASVLGGYVKPDDALARSARKPAFEPQLPPAPPQAARGISDDPDGGVRRPASSASPVPPLDLPPIVRTPVPPLREPFAEAEEGYIEASLPDPGAADYVAETWELETGAAGDHDETSSLPATASGGPSMRERTILSQEVADATATAFDRLADTIVSQASGGARSIEDITRDLLRPMLKAWLDANLQSVVERLVREEIDRVARRSGR